MAAPKGPILCRSIRKGLSLIEAASGEEIVRLEIGAFEHAAFTPESGEFVVADKKHLDVWDTSTGKRLHRMAWPESVAEFAGRGDGMFSGFCYRVAVRPRA